MPESNQPFKAAEVLSKHDITHHPDSANDDLPELDSEDFSDVDLQFCDDEPSPVPFEPPEDVSPVAPVALARVSFNEKATLSFDGYQETFQVTLLNLSTQGVACLGPHGLNVTDAVRLAFALAPGEEPAQVLCEVMWSQPSTPREDAYGLRFTALDDTTSMRIENIVRQRCDMGAMSQVDGFDSAVVMAAVSSRPPAKPSMSPWVVASAGAAMGMLATLAVMVLVESNMFTGPAAKVVAPAPLRAAPPVVTAPAPQPAQIGARVAPDKAAPDVKAVPEANKTAPEAKAAPAAKPADTQSAPAAKPADTKAAPAVQKASSAPAPAVRMVGDLRVEETADSVALTLRTSGPATLHEEFWLSSPPRLVVDVPAARNGLQGHQFDVANALVARVRVGDHDDKVRFVIETGKNVSSRVRAKASGNALRIELRRKG